MGVQNKKQEEKAKDPLAEFLEMDNEHLDEGTSTYHKFKEPGETLNGLFMGVKMVRFEGDDKETECSIIKDINGEQHLLAQTIVTKELKKKWDELKEVSFPVRIIYKGFEKAGTPEQYQNFRLLFAKK